MTKILIIIFFSLLCSSCHFFEGKGPLYFSAKKENVDAIEVKPQSPEKKLALLQREFFDIQCLKCHNPDRPKRLDLTNPDNLNLYFDEILFRVTEAFKTGEGQMPPRGEEAPESIVKIYKEWKKEITYLSLQENFLKVSCLRCHNSERPNRLDLSSAKNILENYDDILYRITEAHETSDGQMPPSGEKPTTEQVHLLELYKKLVDDKAL